jgi:excisionase family DNA binding protein
MLSLPTSALLTEEQAADRLQVSRQTVRRLIEAGRLDAQDVGIGRHKYRIPADSLITIKPADAPEPKTPAANVASRRRRQPVSLSPVDLFA